MGLKIGQVAQLTGMTVEAIRYYEDEVLRRWLQTAPFYRTQLHVDLENIMGEKDEETWMIVLEKDYFEFLKPPVSGKLKRAPEALYLHTIIDMGEKGTLLPDLPSRKTEQPVC